MTVQEFATQLDGVKRSGRGWIARCPAHPDKTPSLSIHEGDIGLLVRCFAGCQTKEIVAALGLELRDLFYDSDKPRHQQHATQRTPRIDRNAIAFSFRFHGNLLFLRSTAVLDAAKNTRIAEWTDKQLDRALGAVATAYSDLDRANLFDNLAFNVRSRILEKEKSRAA